ncbi:IS5/IS1182 family transposase, partial [Exiguobacterium acetylicum]|nr:IS5/IS1182 family transposase [Exiguobacterium acetylicum]
RGVKKTTLQAMLTFIALNLKKLANWSWDSPRNPRFFNILMINTYNKPSFRLQNDGLSTI